MTGYMLFPVEKVEVYFGAINPIEKLRVNKLRAIIAASIRKSIQMPNPVASRYDNATGNGKTGSGLITPA